MLLGSVWRQLWRSLPAIILCALLGAAIGYALSSRGVTRFSAGALLIPAALPEPAPSLDALWAQPAARAVILAVTTARSDSFLVKTIERHDLVPELVALADDGREPPWRADWYDAAENRWLDAAPASGERRRLALSALKRALRIKLDKRTGLVSITASAPAPEAAFHYASAAVEELRSLPLPPPCDANFWRTLEMPRRPDSAAHPNRKLGAVMGGALAAILAGYGRLLIGLRRRAREHTD